MDPYPISFEADYGDGARSKGLAVAGLVFFFKLVLLLPHLIISGVLQNLATLLAYIGYFFIAFTGRQPDGLVELITGAIDWNARAIGWFWGATDEYPPFALESPGYPVRVTYVDPVGERSKGWALAGIFGLKFIAAVPSFIVLAVLLVAAWVAVWFAFLITAFTGVIPRGLFDFFAGVSRWSARLYGWLSSLTDRYPPFSLT